MNALYSYCGERLSAHELADKACQIEIDILGHPIGKQDQFAAAYGGVNYFAFERNGIVNREKIDITEEDKRLMDNKLMMFYTGIRRSADGILAEQSAETSKKLDVLNYMREQANDMKHLLMEEGFNNRFAEMMDAGWQKKKSITNSISNERLRPITIKHWRLEPAAVSCWAPVAGGFILLYCDEQYQNAVREAVGLMELNFRIARYGSRVVYFA